MGFEGLLGNERLKENLRSSINRGRISHFFLITGPQGSGKRTLARLLAAAVLCRGREKPCGVCPCCRKALGSGHPDLITVDDPEKKTVPVELIRQARSDIYIRPNEADRKVYLIPRAQDLGIPGQNALLKVLEEPPAYGVFLLLADNPQKLLPTVRSRCTELTLTALPERTLRAALAEAFPQASREDLDAAVSRCGGWLGQGLALLEEGAQVPEHTLQFLAAYAHRDPLGLVTTLAPMERWKRDQLIPVLGQWIGYLEGVLAHRSGLPCATPLLSELVAGRSARELNAGIRALQRALELAQGNISPGAICGWLRWELR